MIDETKATNNDWWLSAYNSSINTPVISASMARLGVFSVAQADESSPNGRTDAFSNAWPTGRIDEWREEGAWNFDKPLKEIAGRGNHRKPREKSKNGAILWKLNEIRIIRLNYLLLFELVICL